MDLFSSSIIEDENGLVRSFTAFDEETVSSDEEELQESLLFDSIAPEANRTWKGQELVPLTMNHDVKVVAPISYSNEALKIAVKGIAMPYHVVAWLAYYTTYPARCAVRSITSTKVAKSAVEIIGTYGANYATAVETQSGYVAVEYGANVLAQIWRLRPLTSRIFVAGAAATFGAPLAFLVMSIAGWAGGKVAGWLFKKVGNMWYGVDPKTGTEVEIKDKKTIQKLEAELENEKNESVELDPKELLEKVKEQEKELAEQRKQLEMLCRNTASLQI